MATKKKAPVKPTAEIIFQLGRDALLFLVGLGGVIYETAVHVGPPRSELLLLFASMMGLPAFLRRDEKKEKEE